MKTNHKSNNCNNSRFNKNLSKQDASSSGHGDVLEGPDLNGSRSPYDKKLYRQIILSKNGLRVVLISDTVAMGMKPKQPFNSFDDDDEEDSEEEMEDSSEEDDEEEEIRKAAAAMVVGVGSYFDPPYAQGLAHFLEHMLFMGTTKYPQENAYDAFMSKYGGSDNAYTDMEHTMYHFDIIQEKLFQALDMFAQFFIDPLMIPNAAERELNSIESEFQLHLNDDECRWQQILAHTSQHGRDTSFSSSTLNCQQQHPFTNFAWGNIKSLLQDPQSQGIDMMKELRNFYHRYYYAANMRLVVVGAYTLDELQHHVVQSFSDIPSVPRGTMDTVTHSYDYYPLQHIHQGTWKEQVFTPISQLGLPFPTHSLQKIYKIVPVKDRHTLTITWQITSQRKSWRSRPCDYIGHLLGHEAKGSLLSYLKSQMWVNSCSAGVGSSDFENASSHALFTMNFTLTEEGVSYWKDIITMTYRYIGMLRYYCDSKDGLPSYIYDELRRIQECSFHFEDELTPSELVEDIADILVPYKEIPPERLLDCDILLFEFDNNQIKDILDKYMQPRSARIDLSSSLFGRAGDFVDKTPEKCEIEPYFSTQFWCESIAEDVICMWADAALPKFLLSESPIYLPSQNPFIPCDFNLKPLPLDDSHHPLLNCSIKVCIAVGKSKLWFPATVTRYDASQNRVLVSHEDEDEQWYKLDSSFVEMSHHNTIQDFEGTLEGKRIKFKVLAAPKAGQVSLNCYDDVDDGYADKDNLRFPSIPPAQAKNRLPNLVINTKFLKLWHLQDRKFKRPKAEFRLTFICPYINKGAKYRACAELLAMLCSDACTETCYLASVCELNSSISVSDAGFTIRVHGYNDKILDLTNAIMATFFSFFQSTKHLPSCIISGRFEKNLESLLRKYCNMGISSSSLCGNVRLRCLRKDHWSAYSKAEAIRSLSVDDFMSAIAKFKDEIFVESFLHGNSLHDDAVEAVKLIQKYVIQLNGKGVEQQPTQQVLMVPMSETNSIITIPCLDMTEPSTAVEVYFQMGKDDIVSRVLIDLLAHLIHEPLFHELRTKEQFGYDVHASSRWTFGVMGLSFCVVTSSKSAQEVTIRLENFLRDYRETLVNMSPQVFLDNIIALAETKLESFTSLEDECGHLWYEIAEKRYDWEVNRNEVVALRSITFDQAMKAFDMWLFPSSSQRRRLVVQVIGMHEHEQMSWVNGQVPLSHNEVSRLIDDEIFKFHEKTMEASWGN